MTADVAQDRLWGTRFRACFSGLGTKLERDFLLLRGPFDAFLMKPVK